MPPKPKGPTKPRVQRLHGGLKQYIPEWSKSSSRRRMDGELKMSRKKVVLVNTAEPLPNMSFLI